MIEVLILRLDAPLMSFGGVMVDNRGVSQQHPARSMLAGLLANALGWDHREAALTEALQTRLRYAARRDRQGRTVVDFQTVDLGQDFLAGGWTTRGAAEGRTGGTARRETHIRHRQYLADAVYTVALTLVPAAVAPTLADLAAALREPERPLFLGRKTCLPAGPLLVRTTRAPALRAALATEPRAPRADARPLRAWWPEDEGADEHAAATMVAVTDERDWHNQVHVGRRFVYEGEVDPPAAVLAASSPPSGAAL